MTGMGIPVHLVGEGIDWAAWVQAVGSVIAIAAAIWIDRGSARRQESANEAQQKAVLAEHAELVLNWQRSLRLAVEMLENLAGQYARGTVEERFDADAVRSRLFNMGASLDLYLRGPPPNPSLGLALVSARNLLSSAKANIDWYMVDRPNRFEPLLAKIAGDARSARDLLAQYEGGVL
jgi:hypothetical protein